MTRPTITPADLAARLLVNQYQRGEVDLNHILTGNLDPAVRRRALEMLGFDEDGREVDPIDVKGGW